MRAIEQNSTFQIYAKDLIGNIPKEKLCMIINLILIEAARNMGNEFNEKILDATIEVIEENFRRLPLITVASAIYRGSMGQLGAGRLIPKTIYQWLREVSMDYEREKDHQAIEARLNSPGTPVDLKIYPMGSALNKKLEWLVSGVITSEQYDDISLKKLAEMIGQGVWPTPEMFGIKS